MNERQEAVPLTVYIDGIQRIEPSLFFCELGVGGGILKEKEIYDSKVVVKFNI